ncbi:hypothetical protein HKX48_007048 [Thoreauomyces humboldtii]|nr:hypothetical protein HKX48_007048 [Thoreauomyces humboldtii]
MLSQRVLALTLACALVCGCAGSADPNKDAFVERTRRAPTSLHKVNRRSALSLFAGLSVDALAGLSAAIDCYPIYENVTYRPFSSIATYCNTSAATDLSEQAAITPDQDPSVPLFSCSNATQYMFLFSDSAGAQWIISPTGNTSLPAVPYSVALQLYTDPTLASYWATCSALSKIKGVINPLTRATSVPIITPTAVTPIYVTTNSLEVFKWQPWRSASASLCAADWVGCVFQNTPLLNLLPLNTVYTPPSAPDASGVATSYPLYASKMYVDYTVLGFPSPGNATEQLLDQFVPQVFGSNAGSNTKSLIVVCMPDLLDVDKPVPPPVITKETGLSFVSVYDPASGLPMFSATLMSRESTSGQSWLSKPSGPVFDILQLDEMAPEDVYYAGIDLLSPIGSFRPVAYSKPLVSAGMRGDSVPSAAGTSWAGNAPPQFAGVDSTWDDAIGSLVDYAQTSKRVYFVAGAYSTDNSVRLSHIRDFDLVSLQAMTDASARASYVTSWFKQTGSGPTIPTYIWAAACDPDRNLTIAFYHPNRAPIVAQLTNEQNRPSNPATYLTSLRSNTAEAVEALQNFYTVPQMTQVVMGDANAQLFSDTCGSETDTRGSFLAAIKQATGKKPLPSWPRDAATAAQEVAAAPARRSS